MKNSEPNLAYFPWEKGLNPDFVNPEGFAWYLDKDMTAYAKKDMKISKGLKGVAAFFVKKDDFIRRVLIDDKQNILHEGTTIDGIAAYIDALKIARGDR